MVIIKKMWKCEHCVSFYEQKKRAFKCAEKDIEEIIKHHPQLKDKCEIMVTKYQGELTRCWDRQNKKV